MFAVSRAILGKRTSILQNIILPQKRYTLEATKSLFPAQGAHITSPALVRVASRGIELLLRPVPLRYCISNLCSTPNLHSCSMCVVTPKDWIHLGPEQKIRYRLSEVRVRNNTKTNSLGLLEGAIY